MNLPPLPEPKWYALCTKCCETHALESKVLQFTCPCGYSSFIAQDTKFSADQMHAYAAAAVELNKQAVQAVPEGWKLVPIEATWEMTRCGFNMNAWKSTCDCGQVHSGGLSHNKLSDLYSQMLSAAPQPDSNQKEGG
jgi:hypothetical protein